MGRVIQGDEVFVSAQTKSQMCGQIKLVSIREQDKPDQHKVTVAAPEISELLCKPKLTWTVRKCIYVIYLVAFTFGSARVC
jgi:hypothetical protein